MYYQTKMILSLGLIILSAKLLSAQFQPFPGRIGVNIEGVQAAGSGVYVDAVKETERYYYVDGDNGTIIPVSERDENGWPTIDFSLVLMDKRPVMEWNNEIDDPEVYRVDVSGIYKCSFKGSATIEAVYTGPWRISSQVFDSIANRTTFDLTVDPPGAQHGLIFLKFRDTKRSATDSVNSGITNFSVIRPGYHDRPAQLFTDEFISAMLYGGFGAIRGMEFTGTAHTLKVVFPNTIDWDTRKIVTDASYENIPGKQGHAPWEHFVKICNLAAADMWINIPISASDSYIENLAILIQDSLNSELNVYLEIDNEVWGYENPMSYNRAQATDLGITPTQNYARLVKRAADIFGTVFGIETINVRVRPVLMERSLTEIKNMLNYLNGLYSDPSAYIYGIGQAHYVDAYYGDVDQILNDYYLITVRKSHERRAWVSTANQWNIPGGLCSYEGGPGLSWLYIGDNSNSANFITAHRDPSMAALVRFNLLEGFLSIGGTLPLHFTLSGEYTRYGCWGLTDDLGNPDRNFKFQAVREILGEVTTPQPPQQFESASIDQSKVDFIWTDISDNENGFRIERRVDGGAFNDLATVSANETSYSDESVQPDMQYTYRINAFNQDGNSTSSLRLPVRTFKADSALVVQPKYVYDVKPYSAKSVNTINGTGITEDELIATGHPIPDAFPEHSIYSPHSWLAYALGDSAHIIYDLGQTFNLSAVHLWNYNVDPKQSVKDGSIRIAPTLAGLDTAGIENFNFVKAPKIRTYRGENYFFTSNKIGRYVRFDLNTSWGGIQGPGISEIRFLANASANTDAPSSPTNILVSGETAISANIKWNPSVGGEAIVSYEVFSDTTLLVSAADTKIIVSGLQPDSTYDVYIRAVDYSGHVSEPSDTVSLTTLSISTEAFLQDEGAGGLVAVEAEHFDENLTLDSGEMKWKVYLALPGASGRKCMQAYSGGNYNVEKSYASISPRLDYFIKFKSSGTHYVWLRGHAKGEVDGDEAHAGLNGKEIESAKSITVNAANEWKWSDTTSVWQRATIDIPEPGVHVLNIWIKETGFFLDKIVLNTDSLYQPAEKGPDESPRGPSRIYDESTIDKLPKHFSLRQNYPNPFNPQTTIFYELPRAERVRLDIYDVTGRLVIKAVDRQQKAGSYQYIFRATNLASGLYFYRLTAGNFIASKRMLFLK